MAPRKDLLRSEPSTAILLEPPPTLQRNIKTNCNLGQLKITRRQGCKMYIHCLTSETPLQRYSGLTEDTPATNTSKQVAQKLQEVYQQINNFL